MKVLFCDHIAGISGNMFAASCIDAGLVTEEEIKTIPQKLDFPKARIIVNKVKKAHIASTHVEVDLSDLKRNHGDDNHSHHLTYREITDIIEHADLSSGTKQISKSIYKILAECEAKVHNSSLEKVHFHEVGNPDSLIDVVLAGYILSNVQYDLVYSTPVKLGKGTVKIQHGTYPVPPPASAILAEGFQIGEVPDAIKEKNIELSTPTGLAILKYLKPEFSDGWTGGKLLKQGYGAGSMNLDGYPNLFRVALLEAETKWADSKPANLPYQKGEVMEIACNIDDQTAEKTGWCMDKLLEMGALDVWFTPIHMKKNRLAVCMSLLVDKDNWERYADWILRNTSTFGIRYKIWNKLRLDRHFEKRITDDNSEITYKVGTTTEGEVLKSKPEYEEAKNMWEKS